jgi:hypothetical protein
MSRPRWRLTVRSGPDVEHSSFDDLDEAVAAMRGRALELRSEGPPPKPVNSLRRFEPRQQVQARLQLSGRGRLFHRPTAGVDLRGDGTFVPFAGGVTREELDPTDHDTPFDLVRETLEER